MLSVDHLYNFFGEMRVQVLCPFLNQVILYFFFLTIELQEFLPLSYKNSLYILEINPLSETRFANIFCLSMGCLCTLLIVTSAVQKCFSLMYSGLFCLFLLPGLWCHLHEIISKSNVIKIFLMFSSRSFTFSGLMFKPNPF